MIFWLTERERKDTAVGAFLFIRARALFLVFLFTVGVMNETKQINDGRRLVITWPVSLCASTPRTPAGVERQPEVAVLVERGDDDMVFRSRGRRRLAAI